MALPLSFASFFPPLSRSSDCRHRSMLRSSTGESPYCSKFIQVQRAGSIFPLISSSLSRRHLVSEFNVSRQRKSLKLPGLENLVCGRINRKTNFTGASKHRTSVRTKMENSHLPAEGSSASLVPRTDLSTSSLPSDPISSSVSPPLPISSEGAPSSPIAEAVFPSSPPSSLLPPSTPSSPFVPLSTPAFSWYEHWYPVSLLRDLSPSLSPYKFQLLGIPLVVWWDKEGGEDKSGYPGEKRGGWRVMRDVCPHRLAPLSEGRVNPISGNLQCSYHGWEFDGKGKCSLIPQIESNRQKATQSCKACVENFPVLESDGMLFLWPEGSREIEQGGEGRKGGEGEKNLKKAKDEVWKRAYATPPVRLPSAFYSPSFSHVSIQRDLHYSFDILMENVSDPSHINFAHHGVTGRRDRAVPLPFEVTHSSPAGFEGRLRENKREARRGEKSESTSASDPKRKDPKLFAKFIAPFYMENMIVIEPPRNIPFFLRPSPPFDTWQIFICSFNVPMTDGKSRSIVWSARNFGKFTVPKSMELEPARDVPSNFGKNKNSNSNLWWQLYPRWLEHMTSNLVYDGDMIVLQGQEEAYRGTGESGTSESTDAGGGEPLQSPLSPSTLSLFRSRTFTPAGADRLVLEFRRWLYEWGGGGPSYEGGKDRQREIRRLSKREMLDRFSQHTAICSSCRSAFDNAKRGMFLLISLSLLLFTSALVISASQLPCTRALVLSLSLFALSCAAAAGFLHFVVLPRFEFLDYVHKGVED